MLRTEKIKDYYKYLIYIFPALYLLLGFYFRQVFGDLSLRSIDPEYIHFISALCVSTGKFSQANIDHPGSVLQLLLAVVFRVVYFFRGHNLPYFQDVISNSDLYLSVGNLVITAIISIAMLWAGKAVIKITDNVLYALVIQTSPFLLNIWYDIIGRIYPELLFVVPVFILQVLLLREIYHQDKNYKPQIFLYAFAIAFGMSLKMTFLPFFVLPLFLIKNIRNKLRYLLYTIISFFLLSLPVVFQLNKFRHWMESIFIHSGAYEGGNKNIIDPGLFVKNFKTLLSSERDFFYAAITLLVLLIVLVISKRSKRILLRISLGLTLIFLGFVFIVSKQYAVRYFIPALLFFPFMLILLKEIVESYIGKKIVRIVLSILLIIIIGYKLKQEVPYMRVVSKSVSAQMAARIETRDVVKTLKKDSYKIIVSQDYGSPFSEYAIMYSFAMGGKNWPGYKEKLNKLYPDTYQYFTWDNTLKYWGKGFNPNKIIASGKPVYLYLQKGNQTLYDKTIHKLFQNYKDFLVKKKLIFKNPQNGEAILQIYFSKVQPADSARHVVHKK